MTSKHEAVLSLRAAAGRFLRPWPVFACLVLAYAVQLGASGWISDISAGWRDLDSMMRLVEVRDLLGGQGWYDLTQYRLSPPAGVLSHWSRLVDAPIAGLIALLTPFVGRPEAELVAVNLWPPLLFLPFSAGLAAIAHRFAGWAGVGFTLLMVLMTPVIRLLFADGNIDHHNVQATLLVWLVAGLVRADGDRRWAALAGAMTAASLAVGLETLLAVLLAMAGLVIAWVRDGARWRGGLITYMLVFAGLTAAIFLATVPAGRWTAPACDALSIVYLAAAAVGGVGVAAAAFLLGGHEEGAAGLLKRGGGVLAVGGAVIALAAICFPACLHGPYGQVDPRLGPIWLDHVEEAQGLVQTFADRPWLVPILYLPPLCALAVNLLAWRALAAADRPAFGMVVAILAGSLVLGALQLRALVGAQVVAAAAVGASAATIFRATAARNDLGAVLRRWSFLPAVPLFGLLVSLPLQDDPRALAQLASAGKRMACQRALREGLAAVPAGVVISSSNYGPLLLEATPHSVLAAPYHRNAAGLLSAFSILTADDGRAEFERAGGRYLALCLEDSEVRSIAEDYPQSLVARLAAGRTPKWLVPLAAGGPAPVWRHAAAPAATP